MANIDDFVAKQPLTANHLNEMVHAINGSLPITPGEGLLTTYLDSGGSVISLSDPQSWIYTPIVAKVTTTGPMGTENDFTDYRYWVDVYINANTATTNLTTSTLAFEQKAVIDPEKQNSGYARLAVFSADDYFASTRSLSDGDVVLIMPIRTDKGDVAGPTLRYIIITGGGSSSCPAGDQYTVNQHITANVCDFTHYVMSHP